MEITLINSEQYAREQVALAVRYSSSAWSEYLDALIVKIVPQEKTRMTPMTPEFYTYNLVDVEEISAEAKQVLQQNVASLQEGTYGTDIVFAKEVPSYYLHDAEDCVILLMSNGVSLCYNSYGNHPTYLSVHSCF